MRLYQQLPRTGESDVLGRQLLRSATSVAANYRAACRGRSAAEFDATVSICVEEADETHLWLEWLRDAAITPRRHEERMKYGFGPAAGVGVPLSSRRLGWVRKISVLVASSTVRCP